MSEDDRELPSQEETELKVSDTETDSVKHYYDDDGTLTMSEDDKQKEGVKTEGEGEGMGESGGEETTKEGRGGISEEIVEGVSEAGTIEVEGDGKVASNGDSTVVDKSKVAPIIETVVNGDEKDASPSKDVESDKIDPKTERILTEGVREEKRGDKVQSLKRSERTDRSELLKSAGIQLQGSSESDMTGAASDDITQDRNLEQFSEILLDSDLSPTDSDTQLNLSQDGVEDGKEEGGRSKSERRVRFADELMESNDVPNTDPQSVSSSRPVSLPTIPANEEGSPKHPGTPVSPSSPRIQTPRSPSAPHTPDEIIAGVGYSAEYMGSTPIMLTGNASAKSARMQQAQQVVKLFKDPDNDVLPRFPVTIRISSQCIKIVDSNSGIDLMDHPLYTISYVADIDNILVIMINRILSATSPVEPPQGGKGVGVVEGESVVRERGEQGGDVENEVDDSDSVKGSGEERVKESQNDSTEIVHESQGDRDGEEVDQNESESYSEVNVGPIPRMTCHVLETKDARHVAMVIGQAFNVAYKEFLRATGISEEALEQAEYAHILNAQTAPQAELDLLRDKTKTKKLSLAKNKGDILGIMVMGSGYGSALPTPVIAHLSKTGSAVRSGQLNIGDHIIAINGINMVGMPVKVCIEQLKKCRYQNLVKMTVISCPTVVDITIVRPDLKFQLGFTIQDGVVCSLTRGSIAERSGVRVGHYIIEINGTSTVGLTHKDLVHLLTTTVGDLHLKTMPHLMYKLITGQVLPLYH